MDKFGELFDRAIRPKAGFRRAVIKETMMKSCLEGVTRNTPILQALSDVRQLPWAAWVTILYEQVDNPAFVSKVQQLYLSRYFAECVCHIYDMSDEELIEFYKNMEANYLRDGAYKTLPNDRAEVEKYLVTRGLLAETCDGPGLKADDEEDAKPNGFKELNKRAEQLAKKAKKKEKKQKESVDEKEETCYLTKDGKELFRGSHNQCLKWLQDNSPNSWDHNLKHEGYKITPVSADESIKEGNLADHARTELQIAGLFSKDSDYDGMLGEAVMQLMEIFGEQGHSGFSAACTLDLFKKLASFENLTELTDNPDEWMYIDENYPPDRPKCWQSRRRSDAFSEDGGKTYYTLADESLHYEEDGISWFSKPNNWRETVEWISSKHAELTDSKNEEQAEEKKKDHPLSTLANVADKISKLLPDGAPAGSKKSKRDKKDNKNED